LTDREFRVERVDVRLLHDLRRRVLRDDHLEAPVAEPRDDEPTSLHLAGFEGERLVVSASFYPSSPPVNPELASYQLRYMATDFDVQGRGHGATVLAFGEDELRALGAEQVWATAATRHSASISRTVGRLSMARSMRAPRPVYTTP
jgi:GNAT superfamily N-acetyltransferase